MKFKLFRLNYRKVRVRSIFLLIPLLPVLIWIVFRFLSPLFIGLQEMKVVTGRIFYTYEVEFGSRRNRDNNLMVVLEDSVFIKFSNGNRYRKYWKTLADPYLEGSALKVYVLERDKDWYVTTSDEFIHYYDNPYQVEIEEEDTTKIHLTREEKRIMLENGDSSFLFLPKPALSSSKWKVLIPRTESDQVNLIGGLVFLTITIALSILLTSAILTYHEKLYSIDRRILKKKKSYILWMWFREAG